jgi:quercetin dioxygenase-like cupin family protein
MSAFDAVPAMAPTPIWDGVVVRAVHSEHVTFGVVELDADVELPEHSHVNEQLGVLVSGSLTLRVGEESRTLTPGELWRIPANLAHSGRAGPGGAVAIEAFGPAREDWQRLEPLPPRPPRWPAR